MTTATASTYILTVPDTQRNRQITLAILRNFSGIWAEFIDINAASRIRITTDSEATWEGAVAALAEEPQS